MKINDTTSPPGNIAKCLPDPKSRSQLKKTVNRYYEARGLVRWWKACVDCDLEWCGADQLRADARAVYKCGGARARERRIIGDKTSSVRP